MGEANIVDVLLTQHDIIRRLADEVCDRPDGEEVRGSLARLKDVATRYFDAQEELVYTELLRNPKLAEYFTLAKPEHSEMRQLFWTLEARALSPEAFQFKASQVSGKVLKHLEKEEHQLLPELKRSLDRAEQVRLGEAFRKKVDQDARAVA